MKRYNVEKSWKAMRVARPKEWMKVYPSYSRFNERLWQGLGEIRSLSFHHDGSYAIQILKPPKGLQQTTNDALP